MMELLWNCCGNVVSYREAIAYTNPTTTTTTRVWLQMNAAVRQLGNSLLHRFLVTNSCWKHCFVAVVYIRVCLACMFLFRFSISLSALLSFCLAVFGLVEGCLSSISSLMFD